MALLCSQQLVTGALWAGPPRWQLAAPSPSLTGSQVSLVRKPGQASSPPRRGAHRYMLLRRALARDRGTLPGPATDAELL